MTTVTKRNGGLFDDDDDELFGLPPAKMSSATPATTATSTVTKRNGGLFDDDDDDELFGLPPAKKPAEPGVSEYAAKIAANFNPAALLPGAAQKQLHEKIDNKREGEPATAKEDDLDVNKKASLKEPDLHLTARMFAMESRVTELTEENKQMKATLERTVWLLEKVSNENLKLTAQVEALYEYLTDEPAPGRTGEPAQIHVPLFAPVDSPAPADHAPDDKCPPKIKKWIIENGMERKGDEDEDYGQWAKSVSLKAAEKGNVELLQWQLETRQLEPAAVQTGYNFPIVHVALQFGQVGVLDWLAEREGMVDVTKVAGIGSSYTHAACETSQIASLKWLHGRGLLDVTVLDHYKYTPIIHAAYKGQLGALQFLHSVGLLDIKQTSTNSMNIGHCAVSGGHMALFEWLFANNLLDLAAVADSGYSLSHYAAGRDAIICESMRAKGIFNATATTSSGMLPMHKASCSGKLDVLQWMHSHGILDTYVKSRSGETVAVHAAVYGRIHVLEWLHSMKLLNPSEEDKKSFIAHLTDESGKQWLRSVGYTS